MKELVARIDQKISFILSSLTNKYKKDEVTAKDLEDIKAEREILEEQLENEQALLDKEIEQSLKDLEEERISQVIDKVLFNVLIQKGCFDELSEEEFKDNIKMNTYKKDDIKLAMKFETQIRELLKDRVLNDDYTIEDLITEFERLL